jgi:cytochrome b561
MRLANTQDGFGLISRVIHWGMAIGVLGMLVLGTVISDMQPGLANLWLYSLHKSIGLILLALVLLRIVWHRISPPPRPMGPPGGLEQRLARAAHLALYALMIAVPLTGYVASSATGLDVMLFDRWVLPPLAPVSAAWEDAGFAAHGLLTKLLAAVILLHIAGALKRAIGGDGTLRRMLRG